MLYAYDDNGKLSSLYQLSKQRIEQLRKEKTYFCPTCKESLQIRSGRLHTAHFAHFPSSNCERKHQGESEYHESGKWLLYQWLTHQGYDVELEFFLKETNQRPDLFFTVGDKRIAIEFQCSTIPPEIIEKRTKSLNEAGIFPLWIIGKNQYRQKGKHQLLHTTFHRSLMYYFHSNFCMYYLDVKAQTIIIADHIQGSSTTLCYANPRFYSLKSVTFPQLFTSVPYPSFSYLNIWEKSMYHLRTTYHRRVGSEELQWRQYLYLKGKHFSLIPSVCFLPVPSQSIYHVKAYMWQTRFILDHFMEKPIGDVINNEQKVRCKTINQYQANPIQEYILMLGKLGFVKKTGEGEWVKLKEIQFPTHIDQALEEDKRVMFFLRRQTNVVL
ncbi:competence protein CoiA [Halobacillus amylolyticus]|uniref:Competence protein CoiA n=1 Tax=Halobacillus amylolyticus TaxID=2932259 RepID=A0ABY4HE13_9BACI|nr:competence protein CoiA family protein [Halobacillus amylolyticus]UOR13121.1 competence protein CoiA [Halobacillus amylolyticus]